MHRTPVVKWSDDYYVQVYELARSGMTRTAMPRALGVPLPVFQGWYRKNPCLRRAIDAGRRSTAAGRDLPGNAGPSFMEFVAGRLPENLRPLWDELNNIFEFDTHRDTAQQVEMMFAGHGVRERQHIFLHALQMSNFNATEACRKVNVDPGTLRRWFKERRFRELFEFIVNDVKQDFFESALIKKAAAGDTAAIIFGNRTLNADRGYSPRLVLRHEGTVNHLHQDVDVDDVSDLPPELQRQALDLAEAIQAYRTSGKLPPKTVEALPPHTEEVV